MRLLEVFSQEGLPGIPGLPGIKYILAKGAFAERFVEPYFMNYWGKFGREYGK
jgi:hypothetical protein